MGGFALSQADGHVIRRWSEGDLPKETRDRVREREACDFALWEHSRTLVAARLQAMSSEAVSAFGKLKSAFEVSNRLVLRKEEKQTNMVTEHTEQQIKVNHFASEI